MNLEQIVKEFETSVPELSPQGLSVELRLFVERVRKFEENRIKEQIHLVRSRWAQDTENKTLKEAVIATDVLLQAIEQVPPARKELLEMVARYDKPYFGYDE